MTAPDDSNIPPAVDSDIVQETTDAMPQSKLDWALFVAGELRIPVFPLSPNSKIPMFGSNGFKSATLDLDQIRAWWADEPDANVGIWPGEHHVMLDLDEKNGKHGIETLCARLGVDILDLAKETFAVRTTSGGIHLYYLSDKPYGDAVGVLNGVDIRASGGYVVGAGSVIDGVPYTVISDIETRLAPVRDDLKPILNLPRERQQNSSKPMFELDQEFAITRALDFLRKRSPAIEGIGGNAHTYATAALVKDFGISEAACLQLMLTPIFQDGRSWNDCCLPAWDAPELKVVVGNCFRYGKDRPGAKGGGAMEAFDASQGIEAGDSESPADDAPANGIDGLGLDNAETPAEVVKILNIVFAVVMGGANAGSIVNLKKPNMPAFIKADAFVRMLKNRPVKVDAGDGKTKFIPSSDLWLSSFRRREISEIVFEPTHSQFRVPPRAHNMWQGFAIEPMEGSTHEPLLTHIRDNVCQGNETLIAFVFAWLADLVQRPGDKPGIAIALRGDFGAGKGILYDYLCRIFGDHAMSLSKPQQVTGRFNFHLAPVVLLNAEETFFAGDKAAEAVLKDMITSDKMPVEPKYAAMITVSNHVHLLAFSNKHWAVPAAAGDRRWCVLDVSPAKKDDWDYWDPIHAAKKADGPAHLLHYLLHYKYDRKTLHRPPMTQAKVEQALESLEPAAKWFLSVLRGDRVPSSGGADGDSIFQSETPKHVLLRDYEEFCREIRERPNGTMFWKWMHETLRDHAKVTRPRSGFSRGRCLWLPDRKTCRTVVADALKCSWADLEYVDEL
ncbi:MAG: hypothetical protein GEU87_02380 [Alphaproteobacteria bacterium]|nr:hypothetical protein [Alphaproteobacteria bacterium]